MNSERNLTPQQQKKQPSPSIFSSNWIPNLWDWNDMEDNMNRWLGRNTGVTVSEDNENVYIEAQTPGMKPEELEVSLDHNTLRVRGEKKEEEQDKDKKYYRRAQHSFFYQVDLPTQIQENSEQTEYQDGVLKISFKKTQKDNVKKIQIKSNQQKTNQRNK